VPVTIQGGKTGLVAGSIPPSAGTTGVILSMSKFKAIRDLDVANRSVVVEAGVTNAQLNKHLQHVNLMLPISLGSDGGCQIGGAISTNAGGYGVLRTRPGELTIGAACYSLFLSLLAINQAARSSSFISPAASCSMITTASASFAFNTYLFRSRSTPASVNAERLLPSTNG